MTKGHGFFAKPGTWSLQSMSYRVQYSIVFLAHAVMVPVIVVSFDHILILIVRNSVKSWICSMLVATKTGVMLEKTRGT